MWNYNIVLPTLLVLSVFVVYYFCHPRLPLRINRTFFTLLIVHLLTVLLDYFATLALDYPDRVSQTTAFSLNLFFFFAMMARSACFFEFTRDALKLDGDHAWSSFFTPVVLTISELVVLSNVFVPTLFSLDSSGYHPGRLYNLVYVFGILYIAAALYLILSVYRRQSRLVRYSLLAVNLLLLLGYAMRFLMPRVLIFHIFCLMDIIIIFLSFQNPDLYISGRGNAFNMRAFQNVLDDPVISALGILGLVIRNYNDKRAMYGSAQIDNAIDEICRFLSSAFPKSLVFYLRNGCFAVFTEDCDALPVMQETVTSRFGQPWATGNGANCILDVACMSFNRKTIPTDDLINTLLLALDQQAHRFSDSDSRNSVNSLDTIRRQIMVKRILESALESHNVEVFLQPLFDCSTGKVIAAEALARLRDAEGNLISPAEFIPIAEQTGSIIQLGEQVFETTCRLIREYRLPEAGIGWINVNLSPVQCMNASLVPRFVALLKQYGVRPETVHLEITEQAIQDDAVMTRQIIELQHQGFPIVLDDYGSGYSNLSHVKNYPLSGIKLDMSIVRDYYISRDDLIPLLVQAFKRLNLSITAEGVETEEMVRMLSDIGCDYLQGFFISKPLPASEFISMYVQAV